MTKRILLSLLVLAALAAGVIGMSAFEAHVINVTAHIENALTVVTTPIDFGAVFPQESLVSQPFAVDLSSSFLNNQGRVGEVNYKIEAKPKCKNAAGDSVLCVYNTTSGKCQCPAETVTMNDLCKFLSATTDENGDISRPSYFNSQNLTCTAPNPEIATGILNKQTADISDNWIVDLKVPPIAGYIGQDWPTSCANYVVEQNGQNYGCDLWVEVTGISAVVAPACVPVTEVCNDGKDNDCDRLSDCADSNCSQDPACQIITGCVNGATQACGQTNEGECSLGTQTCADGVFGSCVGQINPTTEICDGLDNDCDGSVDEGFNLGDSCSVGIGQCAQTGAKICNSQNPAGPAVCNATAGSLSAETCTDGLDNDCDGLIDCLDSDCAQNSACITGPSVVINEVAWMGAVGLPADEWIELRNMTNNIINLIGWTLNASDGEPLINLSGNIQANGYYLLERSNDTTVPTVLADKIYFNAMENDGEILELKDNSSNLIDTAGGIPWPAGDSTNRLPMIKCGTSWLTSPTSTSTPRAQNSCPQTITFNNLSADPQYGYTHNYGLANASFTYTTPTSGNLTGTITATGLKPYATYQLKFEGKPTCIYGASGNNSANENIGYLGRWWDSVIGNVDDTFYAANHDTRCITGYLVWDYFTANASGNATKAVITDNSYHVLWCSGGTCGDDDNLLLKPADASCPFPYCSAGDVNGEIERSTCGNTSLPSNNYNLKMFLTEESFHQGPGTWTSVMDANINFMIN